MRTKSDNADSLVHRTATGGENGGALSDGPLNDRLLSGRRPDEQGIPAEHPLIEADRHVDTAVALGYRNTGSDAPVVLASGRGLLADRIVQTARHSGVQIRRDEMLAAALGKLKIGQMIPPELYTAVAEVLAFVYSVDSGK